VNILEFQPEYEHVTEHRFEQSILAVIPEVDSLELEISEAVLANYRGTQIGVKIVQRRQINGQTFILTCHPRLFQTASGRAVLFDFSIAATYYLHLPRLVERISAPTPLLHFMYDPT